MCRSSAANTYSGSTTIAAGTLNANASSALGDESATNTLIFTGGTLQAGGTITSPSTRGVTLTSTGLIDTNNNSVSIAGVIGGSGGLTKSGTGTWTLSGLNTYTGVTTISAGTLALGAAGSGTNSPLGKTNVGTVVSSSAVLDLNGFTLVTAEPLTLNGTGISGGGALAHSSATAVSHSGLITLGSASTL